MRILLLGLLFSWWSLPLSTACDGCGCSVAGGGIGLLTQANARFLSLTYRYSAFELSSHDGIPNVARDHFNNWQLAARIGLSSRFLGEGALPYHLIIREGEGAIPVEQNGIGDLRLMVHYTLVDRMDPVPKNGFQWSLGLGSSAPTGAYNPVYDDAIPDHLNPGAGTWGLLLQSNLSWQKGPWGLNSRFTGQLRSENEANYRFGDQWTNTTLIFWRRSAGRLAWAPFAGWYGEYLANGRRFDRPEDPTTRGWGTFLNAGLEVKWQSLHLSAQWQLPFAQDFSGGETQANSRVAFTLAFLL